MKQMELFLSIKLKSFKTFRAKNEWKFKYASENEHCCK